MFECVLGRLRCSRPVVVDVCAPAGYGKTTLLGHLTSLGSAPVIDCRRTDVAAALRSRCEEALAGSPSFLCLDHLDELDTGGWHVVRELLRERNAGVTYVLVSRRGLGFRLSELVAPHEIVGVGTDDLRLTEYDIQDAFRPDLDPETLERIAASSRGWPVAALLMLRLARERRLDEVFDDWGHPVFGDLRAYLRGEILDGLSPPAIACLQAASAIPGARSSEIAHVAGEDAATAMQEVADRTGLARFEDDVLEVHALLAHALPPVSRDRSRRLLEDAARHNDQCGDQLRAAELFLICAQHDRAAEMLESHAHTKKPLSASRFSALLIQLPLDVVIRYPRLWVSRIACLGYVPSDVGLEPHLRALRADEPPESAYGRNIQVALGVLNVRYGAFKEGDDLLRTARAHRPSCGDWGIGCSVICANRAVVAAHQGRFDLAEEHWKGVRACSALPGQAQVMRERLEIDMVRAFETGNWAAATKTLLESLRAFAGESSEPTSLASLRTFTWFAWLADDVATMEGILQIFGHDAGALAHASALPTCGPDARSRVIEAIVRAIGAPTLSECTSLLERSLSVADTLQEPLLRLVPRIILRIADEGRGRQALDAMLADGDSRFSEEIVSDVRAMSAGAFDEDALTVFGPLTARCKRSEWYREKHGLVIDLLSGTVRRGTRVVNVTERGLDLLACLALYQRPVGRHELIDTLWSDLDDVAAFNALKTCVHRTRQQLEDARCIISEHRSYVLNATIGVDVIEMEALCHALASRADLSEFEVARLERFASKLEKGLAGGLVRWEWFTRFENRLSQLHHRVVLLLVEHARRQNDTPRIVRLAESLLQVDPCNERAYELIITSLLADGNRMEAYREYQRYRQAVAVENGAEPSAFLMRLLVEG